MNRFTVACAAWSCLLALASCKHDRKQAIAASYSSVTKPIPVVEAPLSAIGVASIPVEEEYEVRSALAINASNLAEQLAQLEKELR
jgi:hypothetical protein